MILYLMFKIQQTVRVMVEDKEVQRYAMHIDPVKKEINCWIASEVDKVRELLDTWILHDW